MIDVNMTKCNINEHISYNTLGLYCNPNPGCQNLDLERSILWHVWIWSLLKDHCLEWRSQLNTWLHAFFLPEGQEKLSVLRISEHRAIKFTHTCRSKRLERFHRWEGRSRVIRICDNFVRQNNVVFINFICFWPRFRW